MGDSKVTKAWVSVTLSILGEAQVQYPVTSSLIPPSTAPHVQYFTNPVDWMFCLPAFSAHSLRTTHTPTPASQRGRQELKGHDSPV